MPFIFKKAQKSVASFIIIAIIFMLGMIILIGKGSGLFELKSRYVTIIDETYDIKNGSPVKYKGLEVGSVSKIKLNKSDKVRLEVILDKNFASTHIKRDSVLKVEKQLLGSTFLRLIPSISTNEPSLTPGSLVFSSDMPRGVELIALYTKKNPPKADELMLRVNDILGTVSATLPDMMVNVVGITRSLDSIMAGLAGGSGADVSYTIKRILWNVDQLTREDESELILLLKENLIELKKVMQNLPFGMGSGKTKSSTSIQGGDR